MIDSKLKHLKETWNRLDEFMKVHDYKQGSHFGQGTYRFDINGHMYVAMADEFEWKGIEGLDVAFGVQVNDEETGPYVDYESTINDVDATDVIATVIDIAYKVAKETMPDEWLLSFNPTKDRTEDKQEGGDTKRAKLYKRVAERISGKYGWELQSVVRMDTDSVAFLMRKKQ